MMTTTQMTVSSAPTMSDATASSWPRLTFTVQSAAPLSSSTRNHRASRNQRCRSLNPTEERVTMRTLRKNNAMRTDSSGVLLRSGARSMNRTMKTKSSTKRRGFQGSHRNRLVLTVFLMVMASSWPPFAQESFRLLPMGTLCGGRPASPQWGSSSLVIMY